VGGTERHEAVVKLLLETGQVDVDSKDTVYGQTPLSWAAGNRHEAVVKLLLETGPGRRRLEGYGIRSDAAVVAARSGHEAVVKLLLETGQVDVDSKDTDVRRRCRGRHGVARGRGQAAAGDGPGRRRLEGYGIRSDAASWAAESGHEAVVKLLLRRARSTSTRRIRYTVRRRCRGRHGAGTRPWSSCCWRRPGRRRLKDTEYGRTAAVVAARSGREAVVKLLLETGQVDVDSKDTVYVRRRCRGRQRVGARPWLKLLLETGQVDVDSKDTDGRTPLSWAARSGHEAVVKLIQPYIR